MRMRRVAIDSDGMGNYRRSSQGKSVRAKKDPRVSAGPVDLQPRAATADEEAAAARAQGQ